MNCVSRLPTEVLCHIFIHTLPKIPFNFPGKSYLPPILLTRICRRWREVSLDMPSLWCRLSIQVYRKKWQQAAFYYDSWLKRTRVHPLSLAINRLTHDDTCLLVRTLLQPYIHQISSLQITVYSDVSPKILLDDLQALQELTVVSRNYILLSISSQISRLSTLRTLSKLDTEYYTTFDLKLLSRLDPIWAHLTTVAICSSEHHVVMRLLQLAPNLSSLSIRNLHRDGFPLEPLTHTNIQSLSATFSGYCLICRTCNPPGQPDLSETVPFLNALTLPNLRVLNIDDRSWQHEELTAVGSGTVGFAIGLEQYW